MVSFRQYLVMAWGTIVLTGCVNQTEFPTVSVSPNQSGIVVGAFEKQEERKKGSFDDAPSRVVAVVPRQQLLHNSEPRYFTPASGLVQVVNLGSDGGLAGVDTLQKWKELLASSESVGDETQRMLYKSQLSEIPFMNAGRCFHGKIRKCSFEWGQAIMFITLYVQGNTGGSVNNDMLVLVVQGLTNDGKYAVKAHLPISHPDLPGGIDWKKSEIGKRKDFKIDDDGSTVEKWLDRQADMSFSPTFLQYEQFLSALKIQPAL